MISQVPIWIMYFTTVRFQLRLGLLKAQQYVESNVMNDENKRVSPAAIRNIKVGHSLGCLGHAVRPLRISPLVVWYLMSVKSMMTKMVVEKRSVMILEIIFPMRR